MSSPLIHIGFAKCDITPPLGLPMAGYGARQGTASGVLDPLYARAVVLHDPVNDQRIAIVTADLVAYAPETIQAFRARVAQKTEFTADQVILAVTHTHSGPAYGALFGFFAGSDLEQEPESSVRWGEKLPGVLLELLNEAAAATRPARLAFGKTRVALSTHRRLIDPLGNIRLAHNPAGLTDPEVHVLHARDASDNSSIGTLVCYACHPVVLCEDNLLYSGDFPAYLLSSLEEDGSSAIYLNSTCGNVNPYRRGDRETACELGQELARSVKALVPTLEHPVARPLALSCKDIPLPLRLPSQRALQDYVLVAEQALEAHRNHENFEGRRLAAEVARARQMADNLNRRRTRLGERIQGDALMARLQVARIGAAMLVALPGENFVEFGLELKAKVGIDYLFVFGYTNEYIGYLPTRAAYDEGGYEVTASLLAPGAGEQLTAAALEELQHLAHAPYESH